MAAKEAGGNISRQLQSQVIVRTKETPNGVGVPLDIWGRELEFLPGNFFVIAQGRRKALFFHLRI